ncbi:MAG: hypothetical protein ACK4N5_06730 [Myxococcales bacterium]
MAAKTKLLRGVLLCAVIMLGAPEAAAKCASRSSWLAPGSGTALPKKPSLYLFVPKGGEYPLPASQLPLTLSDAKTRKLVVHRVTALDGQPSFDAYRIDILDSGAFTLHVRLSFGEWDELQATYEVGRAEAKRDPGAVRILSTSESAYRWTCSWHATRNLHVSTSAPAFRVEFASSAEAYASGPRGKVTVDASRGNELQLGHVNCGGFTFPWGDEPLYLGVVALFSDGSESPLPREPTRVEPAPPRPERSTAPPRSRE